MYGAHAHQRDQEGGKQRSYSSSDWAHRDTVYVSFEDAIIDAIDAGISVDSVIGFEKINIANQETRSVSICESNEGDDE